jgi:hypothetical protein
MDVITPEFINQFKEDQQSHVMALSRSITIGFSHDITEDCPNCTYDNVTDASGSEHTPFSGVITIFSGTAYQRNLTSIAFRLRCPVCGGVGYFSVPNEIAIRAHVVWDTKGKFATYLRTPAGQGTQNIVKIKTHSRHYQDFVNAEYFVVDDKKVKPISVPAIRGMKNPEGVVEVYCATTEVGKV